jgi:hypothetical protein
MLDCAYRLSTGKCLVNDVMSKGYMRTCKYLSNGECMGSSRLLKHVAAEGVSNNIRQILLAYEPCSASNRIAAFNDAIRRRAMFGYTLTVTECDHIKNLLRKAEDEMRPVKNTWLSPAQVKDAGIIGPVFAIYKKYRADRDEFQYIPKSITEFAYGSGNVLDGQLRLVAIMIVDCAAVASAIPEPKIIAGLGVETYYDDDLKI